MLTSCYIEFLTLTICVLLAIIVNLIGIENEDAAVFPLILFVIFMLVSIATNADICKTFMDMYLRQSCPDYIKVIIALVWSVSLPGIVAGITICVTVYRWNHKKKGK